MDKYLFLDEFKSDFRLQSPIDFSVYDKDRQMRAIFSGKMAGINRNEDKPDDIVRPLIPELGLEYVKEHPHEFFIMWNKKLKFTIPTESLSNDIVMRKKQIFKKDIINQVLADNNIRSVVKDIKNGTLVLLKNTFDEPKDCPRCSTGKCNKYLVVKPSEVTITLKCHDGVGAGNDKILYSLRSSTIHKISFPHSFRSLTGN